MIDHARYNPSSRFSLLEIDQHVHMNRNGTLLPFSLTLQGDPYNLVAGRRVDIRAPRPYIDTFTSSGNGILVAFKSAYQTQTRGFVLHYRVIPAHPSAPP